MVLRFRNAPDRRLNKSHGNVNPVYLIITPVDTFLHGQCRVKRPRWSMTGAAPDQPPTQVAVVHIGIMHIRVHRAHQVWEGYGQRCSDMQ